MHLYVKSMSSHPSPRRAQTASAPMDQTRYDNLYNTDRAALYDQMARNLHHPRYREGFVSHYNDLTRLNRKMHDLNWPRPHPKPKKSSTDTNMVTESAFDKSSHMNSTETRFRSKYMSSHRMQQTKQPQKTLKDQILEKASNGSFADTDKIVLAVMRSLAQAGCDRETIEQAMQNAAIRFVANKETSELEICIHF